MYVEINTKIVNDALLKLFKILSLMVTKELFIKTLPSLSNFKKHIFDTYPNYKQVKNINLFCILILHCLNSQENVFVKFSKLISLQIINYSISL